MQTFFLVFMQVSYFYLSYFGSFHDTDAYEVKPADIKVSYIQVEKVVKNSDWLDMNTFCVQGIQTNHIRATWNCL